MSYEYDDFLNDQDNEPNELDYYERADDEYETFRDMHDDRDSIHSQLDDVQMNINIYDKRLQPDYYTDIYHEFYPLQVAHDLFIWQKCKEYWMRRYNRLLKELKY